jgi:hypothetical protein
MDVAERNASFWILTAPPGIWALHFALSYATGAIWCAKAAQLDHPLGPARVAIAVYTAVALAGVAGIAARRMGRHAAPSSPDRDTSLDREGFLRSATLLLCGLSAVAIVFEALVTLFLETCR